MKNLFKLIPAPDFPTGGIICGRAGIIKAYKTGRGKAILRGVVEIEETKKGSRLMITQLPYQVNKAELAVKIADLVKNKVIEGITNIKDESDKKGMRLIIDIKRGEIPQVILNQLYKHTSLQTSVSILMLGLLDNRPLVFSLRQLLEEFVYHRKQVIYKRTAYDLRKAQEREHILKGFIIALGNIDAVIAMIKKSAHAQEAIDKLHIQFKLTEKQGKAILEMRLQRLTGMEQEKIRNEMVELEKTITYLKSILESEEILREEVIKELHDVKNNYADERKSQMGPAIDILTEADLIPDEEMVVTLTIKGYIKRVGLSTYGVQHRGGKGKMGMSTLEGTEDIVQDIFVAKNHDELLFFTSLGRVYNLSVFEVPEASRTARGRAVVNILPLQPEERVVKILRTRDLKDKFVVMATKHGLVKRTEAMKFGKIRTTGIRAITLRENDELVFTALSKGDQTIVLATQKGQGIRFKEDEVRVMGRQASGVIGIRLKKDDKVVGMVVISDGCDLLFATENGYGKKVRIEDFRIAHRGGVGVRTIPTDKRNGPVIGLAIVCEDSNVLLIDKVGKIIRLPSTEIRTMGRQAKGVRLIRLDKDQKLAAMVAFEEEGPTEENGNGGGDDAEKSPVFRLAQTDRAQSPTIQLNETELEAQESNVPVKSETIVKDNSEPDRSDNISAAEVQIMDVFEKEPLNKKSENKKEDSVSKQTKEFEALDTHVMSFDEPPLSEIDMSDDFIDEDPFLEF